MADDYRAESVLWRPGATEFPSGHPSPTRRRAYQVYAAQTPGAELPSEHDAASTLGFGIGTLAPEILKIVLKLLGEVGHWRAQADATERRYRHLEDVADGFPGLPCLNTHAFLRELEAVADGDTEIGAVLGMLCLVQVAGIDQWSFDHGLDAGDWLIHRICDEIQVGGHDGPLLAYFGNGAFCQLLATTDAAEAHRHLDGLIDRLRGLGLEWQGHSIPLAVNGGISPVINGQPPAEIVHGADTDRLGGV